MKCQRCESERIAECSAHCSDCFSIEIGKNEHQGYVPDDLGFGKGDNFHVKICFDCGQVQGKFPRPPIELEQITCSECGNITVKSDKTVCEICDEPFTLEQ